MAGETWAIYSFLSGVAVVGFIAAGGENTRLSGLYQRLGIAAGWAFLTETPRFTLTSTVLDAPDPRVLAAFNQRLLGWPIGKDEGTG